MMTAGAAHARAMPSADRVTIPGLYADPPASSAPRPRQRVHLRARRRAARIGVGEIAVPLPYATFFGLRTDPHRPSAGATGSSTA
jgi:hypothetical protein